MVIFFLVLAALIGGAVYAAKYTEFETSNVRLGVLAAVVLLLVAPLSVHVANNLSVAEQIGGWNQFINGSIVEAGSTLHTCGYNQYNCNTYQCDPYEVADINYTYDEKGNVTGSYVTYHTEYNDCPYVTEQIDYWVVSKDFETITTTIDSLVLTTDPQPWVRCSQDCQYGIPPWQRGPSQQWKDYRASLDAGVAPSVTRVNQYSNYILASTANTLRARSTDINKYRKKGLLPDHTAGIPDPVVRQLDANKFQTLNLNGSVPNAEWNAALADFNTMLGMEFQGDMHIVAIPANAVSDPNNYASALTAYWQSPKVGKWAIPKNAIVVVLGIDSDGTRIKWAEARTGMPHGNGGMLNAIENYLPGAMSIERVLGDNSGNISNGEVTYSPDTSAILPKIVAKDYPFARACMSKCDDKGDHGRGFISLENDVQPDLGFLSYLVILLISGAVFAGGLALCGLVLTTNTTKGNYYR